jgi:hypothetical protein
MISTKEAHPPVKTLVVVRTGASKVEITSPAKRGNWICKSLTDGSRSGQFGIGTRALSAVKRMNRTNKVLLRMDGNATCSPCNVRGISRSPKRFSNAIFNPKMAMMRAMPNSAPKPVILRMVRDKLAKRAHLLFRFIILSLLCGLVFGGTAARAHAENPPASSVGPGLTFAIADFDGDRRPDFANIQAGQNRLGSSDYSIQLYLSEVGRQSIYLVAPVGGLLIEARDVDGDHSIDLVVSTAWRKQPVAIFLNNGHGTFSRAALAAFPGAFSECQTNLAAASNPMTDAIGVSPQPGVGICPDESESGIDRSPANLIFVLSAGFPLDSFLTSHAGRAPPSEVRHS